MSADGTIAMFVSSNPKLVPDDTNRSGAVTGADVFIRDIGARTTRRIMGLGGVQPKGDASYAAMTRDGAESGYADVVRDRSGQHHWREQSSRSRDR